MTGHGIRHFGLQVLRRFVQVMVIVLMTGMAYLSLYAHYRAARALEDETQMTGARGAVLTRLDERIRTMDDPQEFLDGNKGTVWSSLVFGLDLTDPLAAAEAVAAAKTIYVPMLFSILIPVVVTLLLGKVFCSWICPANLLLEITDKFRAVLRFAELPPPEVKFSRGGKYVLLAVGLVIAAIVSLPIFALVYPPAVFSRLLHAWVFGTALTGGLIVLGLIVVFELLISPRWWCRTMCPGGALYGLIGWPRLLRVKLRGDRCTSCGKCEPVCQLGLDPVTQSDGIECDNCGECVRKCPEQALHYSVGLPVLPAGKKKTVAGTLTLLIVTLLIPAAARGHHILGLPHYSYKENYPQAPVLEYPATTGPYSVLLVCYPGTPVPGEPANMVFDIKNTETGKRYERPITVRVVQTFTFGSNREILPAMNVPAYDVLHKVSATLPEDGEYVIEMTMDVGDQKETIGFMIVAGDPGATTSTVVLAACLGGLAVFLVTVRAVKKKRQRRMQQREGTEYRISNKECRSEKAAEETHSIERIEDASAS